MTAPARAEDRPELLVVGHVTRDLFGGDIRLGGSASFAARAAATLGIRTALVTAAPADFALLEPLRALPQLSVHVVPSPEPTCFELDYSGPHRQLVMRSTARPLHAQDIPEDWRGIPAAYLALVAGECDRALVSVLRARTIGAALQGWLRKMGVLGAIVPAVADEVSTPPPELGAAVFSEEDHPDAEELAAHLASFGFPVALTRGRRGATVRQGGQQWQIDAEEAAETDPTGAGDVFGFVFTLALSRGATAPQAARAAAAVAARVVEGPGLGALSAADRRHLPERR